MTPSPATPEPLGCQLGGPGFSPRRRFASGTRLTTGRRLRTTPAGTGRRRPASARLRRSACRRGATGAGAGHPRSRAARAEAVQRALGTTDTERRPLRRLRLAPPATGCRVPFEPSRVYRKDLVAGVARWSRGRQRGLRHRVSMPPTTRPKVSTSERRSASCATHTRRSPRSGAGQRSMVARDASRTCRVAAMRATARTLNFRVRLGARPGPRAQVSRSSSGASRRSTGAARAADPSGQQRPSVASFRAASPRRRAWSTYGRTTLAPPTLPMPPWTTQVVI